MLIYLSVWLFLCTDPLVYSCGRDGLSVTLVLVHHMHLPFQDGWTALMKASVEGHMECVKVLLDRGADVNMQEPLVSAA